MAAQNKLEAATKTVLSIGGLGLLYFSLSSFCDPNRVLKYLTGQARNIYWNLINQSNEQQEVLANLNAIPDEEAHAQSLAGQINYVLRSKLFKRRTLNDSGKHNKPHHQVADVIASAARVYTRNY